MSFDARSAVVVLLACVALFGASAGCSNRVCEAPAEQVLAQVPRRLSETGLYADLGTDELAPGVLPYAPEFALWSDGATKRRWVFLPAGSRIDTSDLDFWQFPRGTKFWKEFTRDGVRVETRLLFKYGALPSDWVGMAYAWDALQSDAFAAPEGVVNAQGTPHDVPAAGECFGCHGGTPSRILGFSAVQLAHDAESGFVDLRAAVERGMLTEAPPADLSVPGSPTEKAALGYLHANCSHCHNQRRPTDRGLRCFDPDNQLDFGLRAASEGDVRDTPTYRSAIDFAFEPGSPADSRLIDLVSSRPGMPPLGTERTDVEAIALLKRWIAEMKR